MGGLSAAAGAAPLDTPAAAVRAGSIVGDYAAGTEATAAKGALRAGGIAAAAAAAVGIFKALGRGAGGLR